MSGRDPVQLGELSRVGFGAYRADVRVAEHRAALEHALRVGCNLIDTASNYSDGHSEELVGAVLEETESRAFVVTKVGYVSPAAVSELERAGLRTERLPRLESGTPFSLDPVVLRVLLDLSRARLRRPTLDAVLLHNPERLAQTGASSSEVRAALERAFTFLDGEATAGRLRFYGVSSNKLPTASPDDALDLAAIVGLALHGNMHRFAFIEFPLNLFERQAASGDSRPSLLARAAGAGVRAIANRPLNAIVDGRPVRLALTAETAVADPWETCVELVAKRLEMLGRKEPWTSFRPMQFLRDNRYGIPEPDLVDVIWRSQIQPFLATLFEGEAPLEARDAFARLRGLARGHAQSAVAETTRAAVARLVAGGFLKLESHESLAVAACRYCLDAGADHVLVGMRRPEYVTELAALFAYTSPSVPPERRR